MIIKNFEKDMDINLILTYSAFNDIIVFLYILYIFYIFYNSH